MITAVGHSNNPVTANAIEEILDQCRASMPSRAPNLGIFFTSCMDIDFQSALDRILLEWPDLPLVGCTTDGEISDILPSEENSFCLLLVHSEKVSFSIGLGENLSQDPEAAVRQAMTEANHGNGNKNFSPRLGFVLAEGIKTFGISLDKALGNVIGGRFPLFGGMAGDGFQLQATFQFFKRRVVADGLILVLISGPARFSMRLRSGLRPIGPTYEITRHKDNIVQEIDGKPAASFLKKFLGQRNHQDTPHFPLAVLTQNGDYLLRNPVFTNKEDGSVVFVGTFPDNPRIRLTEFDREAFIRTAQQATLECLNDFSDSPPSLALLMPCASRRHILGTRAAEEHALLMEYRARHPKMRLFGMYAYGVMGPLSGADLTAFHNSSYALLLLGEAR